MESKTSSRKLNWAKRRQIAIDMRMEGHSYEEIGSALGTDRAAAYRLVKRVLDGLNKTNSDNVEHMRNLDLMRLDQLQQGIWHQAVELGDIPSIQTVLKIMERRAKLAGLDKQVQKVVAAQASYNPYDGITDEEAAKVLNDILAQAEEAERKKIIN